MTIARSVADVLAEHVVFEVECIDRMYLNVYVPKLQHPGGLLGYVQRQLDLPIASTAPLAKITDRFSSAVHRFAEREDIPWVDFKKGQRTDDVMGERLASFTAAEGVVFIGRSQEKTPLFRTEKRSDREGRSYPWIVKSTGVVNQFYYYCVDADFGPFFLKFCSYFPFNGKLCINGNHWAQRQAAKAGIGFTPLDNAFAAVEDPAALQAICDQLGPDQIDALLRKWLAILPHPFTPPDRVSLIFDRRLKRTGPRATPGRFRTRVITEGVTPSLHVDYKTTTIKQYQKEGRALRTETTINNTRDFGIGKRLTNLPALREIGFPANRRLLRVQRLSHDPITGTQALHTITDPVTAPSGTRVAGLRLGQKRSHALLTALPMFRLQPDGFHNRDLRDFTAQLRGLTPTDVTPGQITYDLRRLRHHGLIQRIPHSHRYRVTDTGLATSMFLSAVHDRLLPTGLAELNTPTPTPLRSAAHAYQTAIDDLTRSAGLAA